MLVLDKRLRAVVAQVEGDALADIGCDHGKVAISCILQEKVRRAIASDISAPSLQKAKQLADKYNLKNIEFRNCGGFNDYSDNEVDVVVIAGMGAGEIMSILRNIPNGIKRFVLVAHTDEDLLRNFLQNNNFNIISDFVVDCKRHFYHIITAQYGKESLSEKQILLGKNAVTNIDYIAYLNFIQNKFFRIFNQVTNSDLKQQYQNKLQLIANELQQFN